MGSHKIRVLVIDDSALIRQLLTAVINAFPDLEVIGTAADPYIAREMIRNLNPDVLTLDVEMPRMDGLEFLSRLMRLRPMPVVMISTLTEIGSDVTLRALELGAVDFIAKPRTDVQTGLQEYGDQIADKIRAAAAARVLRRIDVPVPEKYTADAILPAIARSSASSAARLVAIGASTGGTEAIKEVLMRLPPSVPGIVMTLHMPEGFTRRYAERLDGLCHIRVKEAEHGERVEHGCAYLAPGGVQHMLVRRSGAFYHIELRDGPPVNRHRPSVDVLFRSVANCSGVGAVGIILTGMGNDGAQGMREMHDKGVYTIAQDAESCVVYGMPKEAVNAGGVDEITPLKGIASRVTAALSTRG